MNPTSVHIAAALHPVRDEDLPDVRRLLAAARDGGQFEAAPPTQRLVDIVTGDGFASRVATVERRIDGFAAVGPLGLVGPPSANTAFVDVVASDADLERALVDWAVATAQRLQLGPILRSLRGSALTGPPGFTKAREIWRMGREIGDEPHPQREDLDIVDYSAGVWPDEAWVATVNESFADHWGGYLPWTLSRWRDRMSSPLGGGPQLLACRNEEPAGILLSRIVERDDRGPQPTGFIEVVGTRPSHRRRGIAEVLVRHALARFSADRVPRALLLVDGGSDTKPADVYTRCGFHHTFTYSVWERPTKTPVPTARTSKRNLSQADPTSPRR